jgi:hypothetical protein
MGDNGDIAEVHLTQNERTRAVPVRVSCAGYIVLRAAAQRLKVQTEATALL